MDGTTSKVIIGEVPTVSTKTKRINHKFFKVSLHKSTRGMYYVNSYYRYAR